jgi:hypothetical protein
MLIAKPPGMLVALTLSIAICGSLKRVIENAPPNGPSSGAAISFPSRGATTASIGPRIGTVPRRIS